LIKATKPKAASQGVPARAPKPPHDRSWLPGVGISNQAMLRLLSRQTEGLTEGKSDEHDTHEANRPSRFQASPPLVQPKLSVGQVNDPLEREADRMADQVMRLPDATVAVTKSAASEGTVQRLCAGCDEEVQRKTDGGPGTASRPAAPGAETAIRALAGGIPLPAAERAFFEPRFGRDFSHVRLHADGAAGRATRSIDARAFTLGGDIAFAPGEYAPGTAQGRRLLAHELVHVVQQADTPAALRVMRTPYPGCDRRTTGLDDADARIDRARAEAARIMANAHAAFPRMSSRTIRLADRHFHCPTSTQIVTVMKTLAAIETIIPSLDVRCVSGSTKTCRLFTAQTSSDGVLELCPSAFAEEFKEELGGLAGEFIWAAAFNAGLDNTCDLLDSCYNDFTVPASDMVRHNGPYRFFVLELAGHRLRQPPTIPCAPRSTDTYVYVPPGAFSNPKLIRPITGYETPPPGSVILTVHEDRAGHKFIYHNDLPDAQVYMPNEPKRYYLSPGIFSQSSQEKS
jgi:hypothetical protein